MVLVGDLGGTKTILAVFSKQTGPHDPLVEKTYQSLNYGSLEAIVQEFLSVIDEPVDRACFGVAGPVLAGQARITNLPWMVDEARLKSTFNLKSAKLLNDLESVAYAIPILEPQDIDTINTGHPVRDGNIAVLAPGTGLGEAFLTKEASGYRAHASEGGHASFAPINQLQVDLLTYLRQQRGYDHVSFERVCSGKLGIPLLYDYLKDSGYAEEPTWLAEQLAVCDDPTPVIIGAAQGSGELSELCVATLNMFVSILGAESGNLALKVLSTGGIYLGGGIPARILEALHQPMFLEALRNKGRFNEILVNMPVHVITNPKAALMGAAAFGLS